MRVHVDFETFSFLDVRAVGPAKYAEHPSTEVLCLGYAIDDEHPRVWTPDSAPPSRLFAAIRDGAHVHCWNAGFEMRIWKTVCVDRMGWDPVPFTAWRDTSAIAASFSLPMKLETCAAALKVDVQKDKRGAYLISKLCKPRRATKNDATTRWTPATAPDDFRDLYSYCATDVEVERRILHALPKQSLSKTELRTWRETLKMNDRGFPIDLQAVRLMNAMLNENEESCLEELRNITSGFVQTAGQRDKFLSWLRGEGVHLSNLQAKVVDEALGSDRQISRNAKRALELRKELSKTSTKKYASIVSRICADGTVKDNLVYHGAGTGRYAGRGLQIQNLPRDSVSHDEAAIERAIRTLRARDPVTLISTVYGSPSKFASRLVRSMIKAPEGQTLYGADLSGIENRVTVWYAEDPYGIQIFKQGLDQYTTFAVDFYGVDYDAVTEAQRSHAKQIILGCCFGMAARTFVKTCEQHGQVITLEDAQRSVHGYRSKYAGVVSLWSGLNTAALRAVASPETWTRYKKLTFFCADQFLFMKLASKRLIAYHRPKIQMVKTPWGEERPTITHMGMNQKTHKWARTPISPGRFTENAVQGTARDVMVHGQNLISKAGYALIGSVHDETISLADEDFGSVDEYKQLTCSPPRWWSDVPLEAQAWKGKRYRK